MRNINYTIGNLLESKQQALVNTVNLEGFMGKGIAYQFKQQFPKNNEAYMKACRNGDIAIGKVFTFKEDDKIIINFPTKDRWREKAKFEYIKEGLKSLIKAIKENNIKSIAIPPLGCGNGGLSWSSVKPTIEQAMLEVSNVDVLIYEPSKNFVSTPKNPPKTTLSHLIVLGCMRRLKKPKQMIRIQKAIFMIELKSGKNFFKFDEYKHGPYSHPVEIVYRQVREFLEHYGFLMDKDGLKNASILMYKNAKSDMIDTQEKFYKPLLNDVCKFCNSFETTKELEICATILHILSKKPNITENEIINLFFEYPKEDIDIFTEGEIRAGIKTLLKKSILQTNLLSQFEIV